MVLKLTRIETTGLLDLNRKANIIANIVLS